MVQIKKEAIDRFLAHNDPDPNIKGAHVTHLRALIKHATGIEYAPNTEPRPYQIEAVALQARTPKTALFFAPRRGKTKSALDSAEHLRKAGLWKGKGIVVVPSPLLLHVWESEIEKHSKLKGTIVRSSLAELDDAVRNSTDLVIIAWSTLQVIFSRKVKGTNGRVELRENPALLLHYAPFFNLGIIDELHTIGTSSALRFTIATSLLSYCRYLSGLTGTPIGRDPFRLWEQFYVLDRGKTLSPNRYFFQMAFGEKVLNKFTPSGFTYQFDQAKLPTLHNKIMHMSLSYGLEYFNTSVIRGTINLDMLPEQRKHYKDAIRHALTRETDGSVKRDHIFQCLRQIASGYMPYLDMDDGRHIHQFPSAKMRWLEDFIENCPKGAKFILFNEFVATGDLLAQTLTKHKVKFGRIYGATSTTVANNYIEQFTHTDMDWMIANTQKACMGISLHAADYMLFFESPVSSKIRKQAEARPLGPARNGRDLFIDDFITSPVEQRIVDLVRDGYEVSEKLFDWRELAI